MNIYNRMLESIRAAFSDGQGDDQTKLIEIIATPVDDEINRIDAVDQLQDESLEIHRSDIGLLKAQVLALVNNEAVPIDPGTGVPADTNLPTLDPILSAPPGVYNPADLETAIDIVVSRVRAGRTQYIPQIITDQYRKHVEDAIQLVVMRTIGVINTSQYNFSTARDIADGAIQKLSQMGYLIG